MMKAKYKKYYDALKGKDFSGGISKMSSAVDATETGISQMQSSMSASGWTELGAITVNDTTIPNMVLDVRMIKSNITGALTQAVTKVTELVSHLTELESLENEKDSLGERWTYTEGGSHSQSEVSSHNNKIAELEKKIADKEGACDGVIAAINGIKVEMVKPSINITGVGTDTSTDDTLKKDDTTDTTKDATKSDGTVYSDGKVKYSIPSDPTVAAKKAQFLGNCDDPSQYTFYQGNNLYGRHNELTLFDNTTGEIMGDHSTIHLKPGETRIITVKLPTDTGEITKITRTTADGNGVYRSGKVVTAKSDIDPDPNNIEYVRLVEGGYHAPSNMALLKNNSYDWIITATGTGTASCSQTCLWASTQTKGRNLKAMINLKVVVDNTYDNDKDKKDNKKA